jgi:hypothetical protein
MQWDAPGLGFFSRAKKGQGGGASFLSRAKRGATIGAAAGSPNHGTRSPMPRATSEGSVGAGSTVSSEDSRHGSTPSLAYDYAHEGQWTNLVQRAQECPDECLYVDKFHNTPLHLACRRQPSYEVVKAMVEANAGALRIITIDGLTPLHLLCYCGAEFRAIQHMVEAYPEAAGLVDKRGRTPLHFSTAGFRTSDRAKVIKCLLDIKSEVVNWEDDRGRTPLALMFEDYAEEIEEGDIAAVLNRMVAKIRRAEERQHRQSQLGSAVIRGVTNAGDTDNSKLTSFMDIEEDEENEPEVSDKSGIDWDEVRECWESITLLIKASYYHLNRDSMLLSKLIGDSYDDNATFNSAFSHNSNATGILSTFSQSTRKSVGDMSMDGASTAGGNGVMVYKTAYAKELQWNIVHATVGVPRCPAKFVQMVLSLYPDKVRLHDSSGNLPLHITAKRIEFRVGEEEGTYPAPLVSSREVENSSAHYNQSHSSLLNLSESGKKGAAGRRADTRAFFRARSKGSIAFGVDLRDVEEEERYRQSTTIIIKELLKIYPDSAKAMDLQGKLPFLLAIEHGKPWNSGVKVLLEAYGKPVNEFDVQQSVLLGLSAELSLFGKDKEPAGEGTLGDENILDRPAHTEAMAEPGDNSTNPPANQSSTREANFICKRVKPNNIQQETIHTLSKLLTRGCVKPGELARELTGLCMLPSYSETQSPSHDVATKGALLEALGVVFEYISRDSSDKAEEQELLEFIHRNDVKCSLGSGLDIGRSLMYAPQRCVREGAARVLGAACNALGYDLATAVVRDVILLGPKEDFQAQWHLNSNASHVSETSTICQDQAYFPLQQNVDVQEDEGHGKAFALHRMFALSVGKTLDSRTLYYTDERRRKVVSVPSILKDLIHHKESMVREAACLAVGSLLGSMKKADSKICLKDLKSGILKAMRPAESSDVQICLARGLKFAARHNPDLFRQKHGIAIIDSALMLAMSGPQKVKLHYNEFLWRALGVGDGDAGLDMYMKQSHGENGKIMMTFVTKVLSEMEVKSDSPSSSLNGDDNNTMETN